MEAHYVCVLYSIKACWAKKHCFSEKNIFFCIGSTSSHVHVTSGSTLQSVEKCLASGTTFLKWLAWRQVRSVQVSAWRYSIVNSPLPLAWHPIKLTSKLFLELVSLLLLFSWFSSAGGCIIENLIHVSNLLNGSDVPRSLPECAQACGDNCAGVSFEKATHFCGMFSSLDMNKLYVAPGIRVWDENCASSNLTLPGGYCSTNHSLSFWFPYHSILKNSRMKIFVDKDRFTRSVGQVLPFTI